jgi:hypothetical protein
MKAWRTHIGTVFLGVVNAALLVMLGVIWHRGEERIGEPSSLPVHELAAPDLQALNGAPAPALNAVALRDQAVFYSRRMFYQPPPPVEAVPVPDYALAGTMALPQGKRIAFVKRKSDQTSRTLHVGDDLDGWHVDAIEASRVVIVRADQRIDLPAAGAAPSVSLLHPGTAPPPVVGLAGTPRGATIRVLGAPGAMNGSMHKPVLTEARTFRPPPTP